MTEPNDLERVIGVGPARTIPRLPEEEAAADVAPIGQEDLGAEEALSLGRGLSKRDLKKEADEAEHDRNERFRNHFEWIAIRGLYLIAFLLSAAGMVWFWHIVTPWHFLDAEQLAHLQNIITGGVLAGVSANWMKKRLGV